MNWLSAVPLLVVIAALAAAVTAWRTGLGEVRTSVGLILVVAGIACSVSSLGMLFSIAGGPLITTIGLALLFAQHRKRNES